MRVIISTIVCLIVAAPFAAVADGNPIAFVNGTIYPVSSAPIVGGTIVVTKGKITAIGKDIKIPQNAQVVECKGKWITPGLIDSVTQLGLTEVSLIRSTVDGAPARPDPVRASVRAADGIDPRSAAIGVARRHGVTSVVSSPSGGLIAGQGAWMDLLDGRDQTWTESVVDDRGVWATFGESGAGAVEKSRASAMQRLREVFDDARLYRQNRTQYQRNGLRDLVTSRLDLEAILKVIDGKQKFLVSVHRASDILAVLKFAKKQKIKLVLVGAAEAWLVADQIAEAKVPVILDPTANLPARFDRRNSRSDNIVLLAKAGVQVVVATQSTHNVSSLRFMLGNAVRSGLSWELALRSATLNPAQVFGQNADYGRLEKGRTANLVVWTGDPFEPGSWADSVLIRGNIQATDNRQTRLRDKYKNRLKL